MTTTAHREDLEPLRCTDVGNARRLVIDHGRDIRYVHDLASWLVFDGRRWARDETAEIMRKAKATVRGLYAEAGYAETPTERRELSQHAQKSESARALNAMVTLAQSEPGIPVTLRALDGDPWLLNVLNGTLNLKTGELREHRREDYVTKLAPVEYDAGATCPIFDAFLETIMDRKASLIRFLQKFTGYSLTGDVGEQIILVPWGAGANGKTTLVVTIASTLGDYARSLPVEVLLAKQGDSEARHELARLHGARFVAAAESDSGRRLSEALVKQLTGGDRITARALYRDSFEFIPTFKLVLCTNHRPIIRGTDLAIWRRVRLLPFIITIQPKEQDRELPAKLRAELPGILAWAVRGCLAWQRDGLGIPDEVRAATAAYRADMADSVASFLTATCVIEPRATVTAAGLYSAYVAWCKIEEDQPAPKTTFGRAVAERGAKSVRTKSWRGWEGIRLRGPDDDDATDSVTGDRR